MIEVSADLWSLDVDARCITTNGSVTERGTNPMGGGCAAEAAERYPYLPKTYAGQIQHLGVHTSIMGIEPDGTMLVAYPTKLRISEPAELWLVIRSAQELVELADLWHLRKIALPRPGCGLGGLRYHEVRPYLRLYLDDRFLIVDYPVPERS